MIAFDTDLLVEILRGNPAIVERASEVPPNEQSISVVIVEEILRARLNAIRQTLASITAFEKGEPPGRITATTVKE